MSKPKPREIRPGDEFAGLRLEAQIGSGATSRVFAAIDLSVQRRCAVKILRSALAADPQVVARVVAEARSAARVNHPGVVIIYHQGVCDGVPFITMELLEGDTLRTLLRRGRSRASAAHLVRLAASAMVAVHDAGLVHGDLKPDNLFVIRDRDALCGLRVKILDFGIARPRTAPEGGAVSGTARPGTPGYMAPEVINQPAQVDRPADVYALGCIFYELLAGRPPFPLDLPLIALQARHCNEEPPSLRKIDPTIAQETCDLVSTMLAKDPRQRPTMAEVHRELSSRWAHAELPSGSMLHNLPWFYRWRRRSAAVIPFLLGSLSAAGLLALQRTANTRLHGNCGASCLAPDDTEGKHTGAPGGRP